MVIDLVSLFQCKLKMYNVCEKRIYFARDTVKKNSRGISLPFTIKTFIFKNKKNELINKKQII